MENGEFKLLLEKLDDQSKAIGALATSVAAHQATMAEKVANLEKQADSDRLWARIQTVAIAPITIAIHQAGKHLGWL